MPTTPPSITALPTPPDPNDRSTFNTRAYPWSVAQQTLATQVGAVAANVFDNATAAAEAAELAEGLTDLAAAAANYKGPWASLAGALAMPASASYGGNFWALNNNVADVTAHTPGVSSAWQLLNIGAGGAAQTTSAVDITLTAASARVQAVTMTATDKSVHLPAATAISTGANLYVVKNTGTKIFAVRDGTGTMLTALDPGQSVSLSLADASTAAGVWVLSGDGALSDAILQAIATTVTASAGNFIAVEALTATQAVVVWRNASAFYSVATVNVDASGTTANVGAISTMAGSAGDAITRPRVRRLSDTQAVLVYAAITTTYPLAVTVNVAGTAATFGAVLTINTVATAFVDVAVLSATQAVVVYRGASSYGEARTLNVSGTTITAGAALVYAAMAVTPGWVAGISGTQLIAGAVSTGIILYAALLTVSGTTITSGGSNAVANYTANSMSAVHVGDGKVLVSGGAYTGNAPRYSLLEASGAAVVLRDVADGAGVDSGLSGDLVLIRPGRALALMVFNGGDTSSRPASIQSIGIAEAQMRIGAGATTISNSRAPNGAAVTALSPTRALVAYLEPSGYPQVRVLEIAK